MGIDKVRRDILSGTEEKLQEVGKKMKLSNEINRFFKMGEGFRRKENYSVAYFMYFKCLRKKALLYITEKLGEGGGFSESEALNAVVEKKLFPINKKEYKEMSENFKQTMVRKKIKKEDVEKIRLLILELK